MALILEDLKINSIIELLENVEKPENIKRLKIVLDNHYWNLYIKKIKREKPLFFESLVGKEFRASFDYLKKTIKITSVFMTFANNNQADSIIIFFKTSDSLENFSSSLKDLIEKNQVDFDNPIVKDVKQIVTTKLDHKKTNFSKNLFKEEKTPTKKSK